MAYTRDEAGWTSAAQSYYSDDNEPLDSRLAALRKAIREQHILLSVYEDQDTHGGTTIEDLKGRIQSVSREINTLAKKDMSNQRWTRHEDNLRRLQDYADQGKALQRELDYLLNTTMKDLQAQLLTETERLNQARLELARTRGTHAQPPSHSALSDAERIRAKAQAIVSSRLKQSGFITDPVTEEHRSQERLESVYQLSDAMRRLQQSAHRILERDLPAMDLYIETSEKRKRDQQMFERGLFVSEPLAEFIDSLERTRPSDLGQNDRIMHQPMPVKPNSAPALYTPDDPYAHPPPPVPTTQRPRSPRSAADIKAEAQRRLDERRKQLFIHSPVTQRRSTEDLQKTSQKDARQEEKEAQERMRRAESEARDRLQTMREQRAKMRQEAEEKRKEAAAAWEAEQQERDRVEEEARERERQAAQERERKEQEEREHQAQLEREIKEKQEQEERAAEELRQARARQAAEQAAREKRLRQEEIERKEREMEAARAEAEKRRKEWLAAEQARRQAEADARREEAERKQRAQDEQLRKEREQAEARQREEDERKRKEEHDLAQQIQEALPIPVQATAGTSGFGVDIEDEVDFSTIYRVKTLYEYQGAREDDLSFAEDEIIKAHPHKDSNSDWWYGTSLSTHRYGFFPRTYVEIIEKAFRVRALYDFNKSREDDLPFSENELITVQPFQDDDSDWWYGMNEDTKDVGFFPKTYVEVIDPGTTTESAHPSASQAVPIPNATTQQFLSVTEDDQQRNRSAPNTPVMKKQALTVNKSEMGRRRRAASNVGSPSSSGTPVGRTRALSMPQNDATFQTDSASLLTWASTMDKHELAAMSAEERKRQETIFELITTEKTYLRDLQMIMSVFYADSSKYLTPEEQGIVFSNIDDILMCNTALLSDMETRQRDGANVVNNIGDVFLKHAENLKCYSTYCRNQSFASRFLQEKRDKDQWFDVFLKTAQTRPECRSLDLSHFLLEPMQRITRYPLLLRQILNITPRRHPDYGLLRSALSKASSILEDVNEETRRYENTQKLVELSRILDMADYGRLNVTGREFVMEGILYKAKSGRKLHGYLFNDTLLLAEPLKSLSAQGYLYQLYREPMHLAHVSVRQQSTMSLKPSFGSGGSGTSDDTSFQIVYGNQVTAVKAQSASQKRQWINQVQHYSALQTTMYRQPSS